MKSLIIKIILVIIVVISVIVGYFYYAGRTLYNKKINETSISQKVKQIKSSKNYTTLDQVPEDYLNAIIAVEDHRYYQHGAVDYIALLRAGVRNAKEKDLVEGGSTITQQVAKNLYFIKDGDGPDRKVAELMVAEQLEKELSKDEILELYINIIYFGNGYYCVYDAAQGYFGKDPIDMTLYESTLLAGVPNAPSVYAPTANPDLARKRQEKVIKEMVEYNYLTQDEANEILKNNK